MKTAVLIIDDEVKLRSLLARLLQLEDYEVSEAGDCQSGLKKLAQQDFLVVLCDVKLPDGNGVQLTAEIKQKYPLTEVILLTAYGNIPDGVQAIKNGAFDYLVKGDDNNRIITLLAQATEKALRASASSSSGDQAKAMVDFKNVIGRDIYWWTSEFCLLEFECALYRKEKKTNFNTFWVFRTNFNKVGQILIP
jgi:DNA-binding NtrC family response regulator